MGGFLGSPALQLLLRLKFKGGLRKQVRRLKQPKHWIFLILGGLAVGSWVFAVIFDSVSGRDRSYVGPYTFLIAQVSMLVLFTLTVIGSFSYRGLYLPKDEIELGFSAPITRSDLVRYRLCVSLMKSLIAGTLFGIAASLRTGGGVYAFAGVFIGMLTIPLVGQGTALLLGSAESRIGRLAKYIPGRVISRILLVVVIIGAFALFRGASDMLDWSIETPRGGWTVDRIAALPIVRAVLFPFTPWASMITAPSFADFAPWFVFAVGLWFVLFESVARISVDYRELSLATSADVARRISRVRQGKFGATRGGVTRSTIGWRVPWLFGRGTFGAVAWQKSASIVRKSGGTLIVSSLIIVFLTFLSTMIVRGDDDEKLLVFGSALIAGIGTIYMCAGLRFDFRADLDIMERIKTWPLRPALLFTATILPEVLLVSCILAFAVVGRSLWLGQFHPALLGVVAFQPLVTLTWVALDNAVYLFSPIRYTPGEEGALQNMGRSMLLMILRGLLAGAVVLVAGAPATAVFFAVDAATSSAVTAWWSSGVVAWFGLLCVDLFLIWIGGRMLVRFDVARDRPV